jgi:4-hydroxybenzoate polyprenyltransferase
MRQFISRLLPALHLTRIATGFSAVASVWFVVFWTHASEQEPGTTNFRELPLWLLLAGAAVNALGLFGFTTALNDVLDRRRDQILNPQRPLPSGRLSLDAAISLVVLTFATAVLGATLLGTLAVLVTILVAGAALFFNAAGKYVPAVGLVVLGLLYAGQMVTPNLHLKFVLPVWVVMTHALVVAGTAHVYGQKAPGFSRRGRAFAVAGWAFWSAVMLAVGWYRNADQAALAGAASWLRPLAPHWVKPMVYVAPLALSAALALIIWWRLKALGRGKALAEEIKRLGALWLALHCAAMLLAQGYTREGAVLGAVAVLGLLGMTVVREAILLVEQPVGYKR